WPINVAELKRIQALVLDKLSSPDVKPGSILTYTAFAHVGSGVPDVNVTALDRLADEGADRIWDMTYLLVHPDEIDADAARADCLPILDALEPKDQTVPRPGLGLALLRESFSRFAGPTGPEEAKAVARLLEDLDAAYAALPGNVGYWKTKITEMLSELRTAVEPAPS